MKEIKELKAQRDAMKVKKDQAVQAATNLGFSPEEIQQELNTAASAAARGSVEQKEQAPSSPAGKRDGKTDAEKDAAKTAGGAQDQLAVMLAKVALQKDQLQSALASSAIEMHQIE